LLPILAPPPVFPGDFSPAPITALVFSCTRSLEFIRIKEALNALEQVFPPEKFPIRFSAAAGKTIYFESPDSALVTKAEALLQEIDAPYRHPPTLFISLDHLSATAACDWLQGWKMSGTPDRPLQAIPDPRTNRVFLLGTIADMNLAAGLLKSLDKLQGMIAAASDL